MINIDETDHFYTIQIVQINIDTNSGSDGKESVPRKVDGTAASFGVPEVKTQDADTTAGINAGPAVLKELADRSCEIYKALMSTDYAKAYMVDKGERMLSVQPTKDGKKTVLMEIDKKTNEVISVKAIKAKDMAKYSLSGSKQSIDVTPKIVEDAMLETNAINLRTGNPLQLKYILPGGDGENSYEASGGFGTYAYDISPVEDYLSKGTFFLNSRNPLYLSELTRDGIKAILERARPGNKGNYASASRLEKGLARLSNDSGDAVAERFSKEMAKALGTKNLSETLSKLGYDSLIDGDGRKAYITDPSMVVRQIGGSAKEEDYGKEKGGKAEGKGLRDHGDRRADDERALVRGRDKGGVREEVEDYAGRSICRSTKDRLGYARLIKERGLSQRALRVASSRSDESFNRLLNLQDALRRSNDYYKDDDARKCVPDELLSDDLRELKNEADDNGFDVYFTVSQFAYEPANWYGYYRNGHGIIFISIDRTRNYDVRKTYLHERNHLLYDEWGMENYTHTKQSIKDVLNNTPTDEEGLAFQTELWDLFKTHYNVYFRDSSSFVRLGGVESLSFADPMDVDAAVEELSNNLYTRDVTLKTDAGFDFQESLIEDIDGFFAMGEERATEAAYADFVPKDEYGNPLYQKDVAMMDSDPSQKIESGLGPVTNDYIDFYHLENQKIALTKKDVFDFYKNALRERNDRDRLIFGIITEKQSSKIKEETGIDVSGYSVTLDSNHISHIENRHIKNGASQISLDIKELPLVPKIISEYDNVALKVNKGSGEKQLVFRKKIGNDYLVATLVSNRKHTLYVQSVYSTKKETPIVSQPSHASIEARDSTSETWTEDTGVSKITISNGDDKVNLPAKQTSAEASATAEIRQSGGEQADGATKSLITDKEKNSAASLIMAGADVKKELKVRLKDTAKAFVAAIKESVPEGASFKLNQSDVRETFAEFNLVKGGSKIEQVADNVMKRLKRVRVTLKDIDGDYETRLGSLMTKEQSDKALSIFAKALKGSAQPTELAKWAKSLSLEKMAHKENVRTFRLLESSKKLIESGSKEVLSAKSNAPVELTAYSKILGGLKAPLTKASMKKLSDSVLSLYTEDSFGEMLSAYGLSLDGNIRYIAEALKNTIDEKGKTWHEHHLVNSNNIIDLLNGEMRKLKKGIEGEAARLSRESTMLAQAAFGDKKRSLFEPVKNAMKGFDQSIRSPISVMEGILGEFHPYVKLLKEDVKAAENSQAAVLEGWTEGLTGKEILASCGYKNEWELQKDLSGKTRIQGWKIPFGQALKILDTYKTTATPAMFFRRGVSFKVDGKRQDLLSLTQEDIDKLQSSIPERLLKWNEGAILATYNGPMRDYTGRCFKRNSGLDFSMLEGIYYPTRAVGDKAPDLMGGNGGWLDPRNWGLSLFNERVAATNAPYDVSGDVVSDMRGRMQQLSAWGEFSPVYKDIRTLENSSPFGRGSTLNAMLEKNMTGWKTMREFIHRQLLGMNYDQSVSILGKVDSALGGLFSNLQQVAMMDIFTQIKTLGSDWTGWQFFDPQDVLSGLEAYLAHGGVKGEIEARRAIEAHSPTLKARFSSSAAFEANLGKSLKGRFAKAWTSPVRYLDMHIHLKAYYMALARARRELGEGASEEAVKERGVRLIEQYSDTTQPTTSKLRVGMYRSGANGKIVKQVFGMFQSMGQNIYQGLYDVTFGWKNNTRIMGNYQKSLDEHQKSYDDYASKQAAAEEEARAAETDEKREEWERKANDYARHKKGHEEAMGYIKKALSAMRSKYTKKYYAGRISTYVAGLIGSGLALTLISKLKKKAYGTEEWDDWDAKEIADEAAYQSFINWIPFIGTLANSIRNDSDLSVFTIDNMNSFMDAAKGVVEAVQGGDTTKVAGKTLSLLMQASSLFGVPAQSMWKMVNGAWYNIDKESNVSFRESMGLLTASSIKSNYSEALEKGQKDKAIANLDVWMNVYSSKGDKSVAEEIYRLGRLGYTGVSPGTYPSTYTNDDGDTVSYSPLQLSGYRAIYSKAGADASLMIATSSYRSLDDEYKAKAMKSLYTAYSQASKAKAAGTVPSGKAAKILLLTNGDVEMARYITAMESLSGLTKEQAVKKANGLAGMGKAEKLLTLWLAGYSLTDANITQIVNWIASNGGDRSEASSMLL